MARTPHRLLHRRTYDVQSYTSVDFSNGGKFGTRCIYDSAPIHSLNRRSPTFECNAIIRLLDRAIYLSIENIYRTPITPLNTHHHTGDLEVNVNITITHPNHPRCNVVHSRDSPATAKYTCKKRVRSDLLHNVHLLYPRNEAHVTMRSTMLTESRFT